MNHSPGDPANGIPEPARGNPAASRAPRWPTRGSSPRRNPVAATTTSGRSRRSPRSTTSARGVSEVGSPLLATGYQRVRWVVAALAGTGPAPPNATRGRWPRQCGPPTETCSPSPAAANSPGPSPSAHRDGGRPAARWTGVHRAMPGLDQPASFRAPIRTQADQLGDAVNTSRPAASDCRWQPGPFP
jgi:hypothetical protein